MMADTINAMPVTDTESSVDGSADNFWPTLTPPKNLREALWIRGDIPDGWYGGPKQEFSGTIIVIDALDGIKVTHEVLNGELISINISGP